MSLADVSHRGTHLLEILSQKTITEMTSCAAMLAKESSSGAISLAVTATVTPVLPDLPAIEVYVSASSIHTHPLCPAFSRRKPDMMSSAAS